jgi:hypothetical protein
MTVVKSFIVQVPGGRQAMLTLVVVVTGEASLIRTKSKSRFLAL